MPRIQRTGDSDSQATFETFSGYVNDNHFVQFLPITAGYPSNGTVIGTTRVQAFPNGSNQHWHAAYDHRTKFGKGDGRVTLLWTCDSQATSPDLQDLEVVLTGYPLTTGKLNNSSGATDLIGTPGSPTIVTLTLTGLAYEVQETDVDFDQGNYTSWEDSFYNLQVYRKTTATNDSPLRTVYLIGARLAYRPVQPQ